MIIIIVIIITTCIFGIDRFYSVRTEARTKLDGPEAIWSDVCSTLLRDYSFSNQRKKRSRKENVWKHGYTNKSIRMCVSAKYTFLGHPNRKWSDRVHNNNINVHWKRTYAYLYILIGIYCVLILSYCNSWWLFFWRPTWPNGTCSRQTFPQYRKNAISEIGGKP